MKNWSASKWFVFMTVFAFASVISFFQINTVWADENNFNGVFGWLGIGVLCGLISAFGLVKTAQKSA
jgi:hypothetical protein